MYFILVCVHECTCVGKRICVYAEHKVEHLIPWNWSYRFLCHDELLSGFWYLMSGLHG